MSSIAPTSDSAARATDHGRFDDYSLAEEIANCVSHGVGALLAIAGLAILVARAALYADGRAVTAVAIYGTSLILMYLASTLFHGIPLPRTRRVLQVVDHSLIYVLIAGTYTPFTLITLSGPWGWSLFGAIWGLALAGIAFKLFTTGRLEKISLALYLLMGWCGVVAIGPLVENLPPGGLWFLLAGGLAYSVGVIFYAWQRLRYHHAIWHGFVLTGSLLHFFAVLFYVLPGAGVGA
jgi:channel protein, hemolysin III family